MERNRNMLEYFYKEINKLNEFDFMKFNYMRMIDKDGDPFDEYDLVNCIRRGILADIQDGFEMGDLSEVEKNLLEVYVNQVANRIIDGF